MNLELILPSGEDSVQRLPQVTVSPHIHSPQAYPPVLYLYNVHTAARHPIHTLKN